MRHDYEWAEAGMRVALSCLISYRLSQQRKREAERPRLHRNYALKGIAFTKYWVLRRKDIHFRAGSISNPVQYDDGGGFSGKRGKITVAKEILPFVRNITVFADKAYGDRQGYEDLKEGGTGVYPGKTEKRAQVSEQCR